ncbi:MAG: ester cyclase [Desulfarculus sp.]|nr:ester cyclase [Desulfarculus sp.]
MPRRSIALALCLTALCLTLLAAPPAAPAQDVLQTNKDLVRGFFKAMITNDQQALPRFFAQGYQVVEIGLPDAPAPPLKSHISPDFRVRAGHLHQALTNLSLSISALVAEGGQVVAQVTLTGTHRGEFLGVVATGRRLSLHAMVIFEIENGRITKTTELLDMLGTMRQLGYIKLD